MNKKELISKIKQLDGITQDERAYLMLQKGELIIKNNEAIILGMGKRYKKILVRHLI